MLRPYDKLVKMADRNLQILKVSLFAGGVYFTLMSIAHLFGVKAPGLFVYYNVESYDYQDKIIGLMVFGWAGMFFSASNCPVRNYTTMRAILTSGALAVLGLAMINLFTDFHLISREPNVAGYWVHTGILSVYLVFVGVMWRKVK